jgi:septum site-determining protein MinC
MDRGSNRERQAFRLKGTMPALTMLCLLTEDIDAIERQLVDQLAQMPQFFLHAPVVVDLEALGDSRVDLARLAELLRRHHLVPVAVRNPSEAHKQRAVAAGWGVVQSMLPPSKHPAPAPAGPAHPGSAERPPPIPEEPVEPPRAGLTVHHPIRSGQVVYAVGGDLVVLAAVSSGAELIADGNIHVYGPLRGRALAGAHDNPEASIFCTSLEAEFLSIDGRYLMAEEIPKEHRGKSVRVHLRGEDVVVTRL